jgi:uncharacterized protein YdeI (BOF family)
MSRALSACVFAGVLAAGVAAVELNAAAAQDKEITLTGCLVRAEDADGYLLTNVAGEPAWQRADASVAPGPVGTSGSVATIFYWLEDDDALEDHVGHRIQVKGDLDGELADGKIEVDRKDQWVEVKIEADGDEMKARVPHSAFSIVPGRRGDDARDVLVRKVNVDDVKMIAASCS